MTTSQQLARILIVDDHPLVREGLSARISAQPDMQVCGEADDVAQGLRSFVAKQPDLTIVDLSLKTGHGLDLIKEIVTHAPKARILVISAYDEAIYAERVLRAGAMGYIGKEECRESVISAIRTVLEGRRYLSPAMTERLVGQAIAGSAATPATPVERLTDRELQVFQFIGQGLTTSEIAQELHLSPHTIDTHREKIKSKLNLKSGMELTQQAVRWMAENG